MASSSANYDALGWLKYNGETLFRKQYAVPVEGGAADDNTYHVTGAENVPTAYFWADATGLAGLDQAMYGTTGAASAAGTSGHD